MIILITPEMNIIDYEFNLTSRWLFFHWKRKKEYDKAFLGFVYLRTFDLLLKLSTLTHFSPVLQFCTPWKRQETKGFLTFSEGIEIWHWIKMG